MKNKVRVLAYLFGIIIIIFILRDFFAQYHTLSKYNIAVNMKLFFLSIFIIWGQMLLLGVGWWVLLNALSHSISLPVALRMYFFSHYARHLPGGIFNLVTRVYMADQHKISKKVISFGLLLEVSVNAICATLLSIPILWLVDKKSSIVSIVLPTIALSLFFIIIMRKQILKLINSLKVKLAYLDELKVKPIWLGVAFGVYFSAWVLVSVAFLFFSLSLGIKINHYWYLMSTFPASWIIGYLSPMPSGIGVRESVLVLILKNLFNTPIPQIIALVSRLWLLASEILFIPLYFLLHLLLTDRKYFIKKEGTI